MILIISRKLKYMWELIILTNKTLVTQIFSSRLQFLTPNGLAGQLSFQIICPIDWGFWLVNSYILMSIIYAMLLFLTLEKKFSSKMLNTWICISNIHLHTKLKVPYKLEQPKRRDVCWRYHKNWSNPREKKIINEICNHFRSLGLGLNLQYKY